MAQNVSAERLEPTKSRTMFLALGDAISNGTFPPGSRLPGELKLAEQFNVSRVTVRRAMAELERMGIVDRRPGVGTVVADRAGIQPVVADFSNVLGHLLEMGRTTTARLLEFDYVQPPKPVRTALKLGEQEKTQRSVRVRQVDGEPFSYLTAFVPESIGAKFDRDDLAKTSLLALLERSGVEVDHADQTVTATLSTPKTADALGIGVGEPLLAVTRTVFDPNGSGVEHLQALYRPNHYKLQISLNRVESGGTRQWAPVAEASLSSAQR
ncbi:MAG: GntR family transcriptional regulator [Pseudomonadota bacterium]